MGCNHNKHMDILSTCHSGLSRYCGSDSRYTALMTSGSKHVLNSLDSGIYTTGDFTDSTEIGSQGAVREGHYSDVLKGHFENTTPFLFVYYFREDDAL